MKGAYETSTSEGCPPKEGRGILQESGTVLRGWEYGLFAVRAWGLSLAALACVLIAPSALAQRHQVVVNAVARLGVETVEAMLVSAPDPLGRQYIYVTGQTGVPNLATPGAFQAQLGGSLDAYVAKLDGSTLETLWFTYLGGQSLDSGTGLAFGRDGSIVVAGDTGSTDFPRSPDAVQPEPAGGLWDLFIAVLSDDGQDLVYGSYLGGDGWDGLKGLRRDGSHLYLVGHTNSEDLPVTDNAFQPVLGSIMGFHDLYPSGFLMRLSLDARTIEYLTYFGGVAGEIIYDVAVESSSDVWVGGTTFSGNLPVTPDAFDTKPHSCTPTIFNPDRYCVGFLASMNTDSGDLNYSTYFGGERGAMVTSLALVGEDVLYVAGSTPSPDFPLTSWALRTAGVGTGPDPIEDGFLLKIFIDSRSIGYSTLIGGDQAHDRIRGMTHGGSAAVVVGRTESNDFVAADVSKYGGDRDGFLSWITQNGREAELSTYIGGDLADEAKLVERTPSEQIQPLSGVSETLFVAGETRSASVHERDPGGARGTPDVFIVRMEAHEIQEIFVPIR